MADASEHRRSSDAPERLVCNPLVAAPRVNLAGHRLERFDQFEHVSRGRFTTVRARLNYVMAAAYDAGSDSLLTVSLPNPRNRRLVVSQFDRRDMTL